MFSSLGNLIRLKIKIKVNLYKGLVEEEVDVKYVL